MQLPDTLTDEQSAAIVQCLRIFAARGRALRLAREQAEREQKENHADAGGAGRDSLGDSTTHERAVVYGQV